MARYVGIETACVVTDKSSELTFIFFPMSQLSQLHVALCIIPFRRLYRQATWRKPYRYNRTFSLTLNISKMFDSVFKLHCTHFNSSQCIWRSDHTVLHSNKSYGVSHLVVFNGLHQSITKACSYRDCLSINLPCPTICMCPISCCCSLLDNLSNAGWTK